MITDILPSDIVLQILNYLDYEDIFNVMLVSKQFQLLANHPWLWRHFKLKICGKNVKVMEKILHLSRFQSLKELHILNCELNNSNANAIISSSIDTVAIGDDNDFDQDCKMDKISPSILATMVNKLDTFYLNNWDEKLSVQQVKTICRKMNKERKLRNLKIVNDQFLSKVPPQILCPALSNLSKLELTCQQIPFQQIFLEIASKTKLVDLDISCNMLTDIKEQIFTDALTKIKELCHFLYSIFSKNIQKLNLCNV